MLHTIQLQCMPHGKNESELGERRGLGVGGSGVTGQMSSVMGGEGEIGHGIIGWKQECAPFWQELIGSCSTESETGEAVVQALQTVNTPR